MLRPLKQGVDELCLEHVTVTERLDQHFSFGNDRQHNASRTGLGLPEEPVKEFIVRLFPVEEIDECAGVEAESTGPR
jgi:hypothetical protein